MLMHDMVHIGASTSIATTTTTNTIIDTIPFLVFFRVSNIIKSIFGDPASKTVLRNQSISLVRILSELSECVNDNTEDNIQ